MTNKESEDAPHDPRTDRDAPRYDPRTPALSSAATALKALFWCAMAAEVAWLVLAASAGELVASVLDRSARVWSTCSSSPPWPLLGAARLAREASRPYNEPDREWTLAETLYALVLFGSLFFGVYAFFGWYYSP
jgi:multisubunit Na+/H+ antiporter MnhB subunit